jgi:APA family basic amino acid/polyamine antiporter
MNLQNLFQRKPIALVNSEKEAGAHALNQTLTVRDLTSFGIAAIVGAGIFSTIGQAVVHGGPAVSLLFLFMALSCGLSALCYAEFASSVPVSGSAYTYAYVSFGELTAWIVGWNLVLEYAISNVAVALSWSDYFVSLMAGFGVNIPREFSILNSQFSINFPAFLITILITWVCYIGIKESRNANNVLVVMKMLVILLVIAVGAFYVKPDNWSPFAPNGVTGVLFGISSVFFAYIGFDAISTTAEECKDPQRDLPRAMLWSLGISTVIYILITLVLTGMVPYHLLGVGDPLAFVFEKVGLNFISGFISLISVVTLSSVMLVYQLGQPRIWMTMSRDGLLPKIFSRVHPKFKTPSFATILMGLTVGIPALFADLKYVVDLTSIGTLFAFALVCGGVLVRDANKDNSNAKFKIMYLNSRYYLPPFLIALIWIIWTNLSQFEYHHEKLTVLIFYASAIIFSLIAIWKKFSLIPVLGLLSNLYLMSELGTTNWIRFLIWLGIGVAIYLLYGMRNSKLRAI